jgi:hypothetical protein
MPRVPGRAGRTVDTVLSTALMGEMVTETALVRVTAAPGRRLKKD